MQPEIEVKFLEVSHDEVRGKLRVLGAQCEQPMTQMRRMIFDYPDGRLRVNSASVRVRDEGNKIRVSYKQMKDHVANGSFELDFTVDSYEKAGELFERLGLKKISEQETKRETWRLDDCEVVLDEWPWLKPFIEIEGPSEASIKAVAAKLDFDWAQAIFGSANVAYQHEFPGINLAAGENVNQLPELRFDDPVPQWLQERAKA